MGGDYTRFTFDPRRDHSGVLMQQGRVQLDADLNELVDIIDRHERAELYDLIGRTGVSRLSMEPGATTPEAFQIRLQGGNFTVGRGRIYVDGILTENHGTGTAEVEDVLYELRGSQTTPVAQQPFLGTSTPQTELSTPGRRLAYLDVWRRELTAVEQPELVEKAVGVDTATRMQTAWQVRVLSGLPQGATCATDWSTVPAWTQATRRSAARLTTQAVQAVAPSDPCLVAATGGYRGLENRLYRVEVHDDGTATGRPLTIKWSRDNASVAARVTGIDGTNRVLGVERVGRDKVMRFAADQWVEITDDAREFDGRPGVPARVNSTDDVNSTVTLVAPLAGIQMNRNPRIRRWDQTTSLTAEGLIQVGALPATIDLEDGVRVQLQLVGGGNARVGDHWLFAARTADASVESLVNAPPRGTRHHYTPLAIVDGDAITDCRTIFPPLPEPEEKSCDCTVCVSPEEQLDDPETLKRAIEKLKERGGGKICLDVGEYRLEQPLEIRDGRAIRIEGKGYKSILSYRDDGPAVVIVASDDIRLADLSVVSFTRERRRPSFGIVLANSMRIRIDRCYVVQDVPLMAAALVASRSDAENAFDQLRGAFLTGGMAIAMGGRVSDIAIRDCVLAGETGIGGLTRRRAGQIQSSEPVDLGDLDVARDYVLTIRLVIEANAMACVRAGVDFGNAKRTEGFKRAKSPGVGLTVHAGETRIASNDIVGCLDAGIAMRGRVLFASAGKAETKASGLLALDGRLDVRGNTLVVLGDGVEVRGDRTRVADNDISGLHAEGDTGVVVNRRLAPSGVTGCVVSGNRIHDMTRGGGIELGAGDDLRVASNAIDSVGLDGIVVSGRDRGTEEVAIVDNEVSNVGDRSAQEEKLAAGIMVLGTQGIDISQNLVRRVASGFTDEAERAGIRVLGGHRIRIVSNQVIDIGPPAEFGGRSKGIEMLGEWDRLDVLDNNVQAPGESDARSRWYAITIAAARETEKVTGPVLHEPIEVAAASPADVQATFNAFHVLARRAPIFTIPTEQDGPVLVTNFGILAFKPGRSMTAISGNLFDARGRTEAVLVITSGNLSFQDNRCLLASSEKSGGVVAFLHSDAAVIVNANHVEGPPENVAMAIEADTVSQKPHATVLGNITDGPIELNGGTLQSPWDVLNLTS